MWQINFCPSCGARAPHNARFCIACGLNLTTVLPQVPPPSYDYQFPYHQWVLHEPAYSESAEPRDADRFRQGYMSEDEKDATPISAEISKLLADLFDRRLKYHRT